MWATPQETADKDIFNEKLHLLQFRAVLKTSKIWATSVININLWRGICDRGSHS